MTSHAESPSLFDCLKPCWLGLSTDNRRLFDVLQDGWLRPLRAGSGLLVGVGAYAREKDTVQIGRIPVRIKLNVAKLPDLEVAVFRRGEWMRSTLQQAGTSDMALLAWPGVLPTFAISELTVSTEEERARLIGLARHFSNIKIPEVPIVVRVGDDEVRMPAIAPPETVYKLAIPPDEDAIHGAMNMAFWAVPRIDPWLAVLTESLSSDRTRLPELADGVDASWWQFPPWVQFSSETKPADLQECLWLAAIKVFRAHPSGHRVRARELVSEITNAALRYDSSASDKTAAWLQSTHRILRAESTIEFDRWRSCPVGMAIQLVLTRPEPAAFKTWFKDRPDLPPAVAWSAAVLCGLYNGYKRLDTEFRGEPLQREVVAIRTLGACSETLRDIRWPGHVDDKPSWRKVDSDFVLSWDGIDFARKQVRERGQWYAANFEDMGIRREAGTVAKKLGWPCLTREITLTDARVPFSGWGDVSVYKRGNPKLIVRGKSHFQLPADAEVEEVVNIGSFRRLIATEFGRVPAPPAPQIPDKSDEPAGIPGLRYVLNFLSEGEEMEIMKEIDKGAWSEELQRRVQHYGWRYDYKARQVDPAMRLGPLPPWADSVARRLVERGLVPNLPDQVIVNEYVGNQGIAPHVDSKSSFEDGIAMVSLLESWEMVFRERRDKRKQNQKLERRSAAIINGEARYLWTHEIPRRKTEPSVESDRKKPSRVRRERKRRISLTFRKVIDDRES